MTEHQRELYEGMPERWKNAVDDAWPPRRAVIFEIYEAQVLKGKPYAPEPPDDDWKRKPRRETVDTTPKKREPEQQDFGDRRLPDP